MYVMYVCMTISDVDMTTTPSSVDMTTISSSVGMTTSIQTATNTSECV